MASDSRTLVGFSGTWLDTDFDPGIAGRERDDFNLPRASKNIYSAHIGYEVRTPMYARAFMEFAFAIPERMRTRGGTLKHLHSRALAPDLPPVITNRRTKAEFSLALHHELLAAKNRIVMKMVSNPVEWLSPGHIEALYKSCRESHFGAQPLWEFWGAFACSDLLFQGSGASSASSGDVES